MCEQKESWSCLSSGVGVQAGERVRLLPCQQSRLTAVNWALAERFSRQPDADAIEFLSRAVRVGERIHTAAAWHAGQAEDIRPGQVGCENRCGSERVLPVGGTEKMHGDRRSGGDGLNAKPRKRVCRIRVGDPLLKRGVRVAVRISSRHGWVGWV